MLLEAQEQFSGMGYYKPTHVFVQAGVGALAASVIGFYASLFKDDMPKFVVVEPDKAACIFESAKINDGKPHTVTGDLDTIMVDLHAESPLQSPGRSSESLWTHTSQFPTILQPEA